MTHAHHVPGHHDQAPAGPAPAEARRATVERWTQIIGQYPRTLTGKFFGASDRGYHVIGIAGGQQQGHFTNMQPTINPGSDLGRLDKILRGGDLGLRSATRANFLVPGAVDRRRGDVELAFLQFQNPQHTRAGDRGVTSLVTTFYLPPAVAGEFTGDVRGDPDLVADVFDRTILPGVPPVSWPQPGPEQVYRTRADFLAIVSSSVLGAIQPAGLPGQQFRALFSPGLTDPRDPQHRPIWHQYARPHGGEVPPVQLPIDR